MPPELGTLALSTMWAQRWPDGDDLDPFLAAAATMGFGSVELSHTVTPAALARLQRAPGPPLPIVALHHPCPASTMPELSATQPRERQAAADGLSASVATAVKLRARAVVFHLGRIADHEARQLSFEVRSRFQAGQSAGQPAATARAALAVRAAAVEAQLLPGAIRAVAPVAAAAAKHGVILAVETGNDPCELPTARGLGQLLDAVPELWAWLDTGHVAVRATLGFESVTDWLAAGVDRWAGAHLHDAVDLRDHLAPGTGHVDFARLRRAMPPRLHGTCEVDWYLTPQEVTAGAKHLLATGWGGSEPAVVGHR